MQVLTHSYLTGHDSYIEALKAAIVDWERAEDFEDKKALMGAIGEIGAEVHKMNKHLGVKGPRHKEATA